MILVRLMGGLGNQMFQYALGRRLSLLHKTDLFIDTSFLDKLSPTHVKREYELGIFDLPVSIAEADVLNKFESIRKSSIKSRLQPLLPNLLPFHIVREPSHAFNEEILQSPSNSLLIGYWQTEEYFIDIEDVIRKDFTLKKTLDDRNSAIAEKINSTNSVSVHVRRGDYILNEKIQKHHGICDTAYYSKAVELISGIQKNTELFLFSDEPEWVKQNMKFDLPVNYIDNTGEAGYIDMQLMSLCKHNIIANSSFSWWGAWLNNNEEKVVIAPEKWFADKTIDTKDVIPAGWVKI